MIKISHLSIVFTTLLVLINFETGSAQAQTFSCPMLKRPACLDYNDKICDGFAKCVSDDAICFNSYTCDFNGFVCKSTLDELNQEYEDIIRRHNRLVSIAKQLEEQISEITSERANLFHQMEATEQEIKSCLNSADDLEEARDCANSAY